MDPLEGGDSARLCDSGTLSVWQDVVKDCQGFANHSQVRLGSGEHLKLPPFLCLRGGDRLEITEAGGTVQTVVKLLPVQGADIARLPVFPLYSVHQMVHLPPHVLHVIFRERLNERDWLRAKRLEQFHYRGKGFNLIPARRTALLLEAEGFGVIGYGVLAGTVSSAKPRFQLFETSFGEQMRTRLINRIVRIPRVVIHPEFRGLGLGVMMARHLVRYASERWDIKGYRPILVEVIASMTDYHHFFETAGFVEVGRTGGGDRSVMPTYGTGSFAARENADQYAFFSDGRSKPYLAFPLTDEVGSRLTSRGLVNRQERRIAPLAPTLGHPIRLRGVSVTYDSANGLSARAGEVKDAFSVDSSQLQSEVVRGLTLKVEPGDFVLVTGASGSGKSTVLKLLTGALLPSGVRAYLSGTIEGWDSCDVAVLAGGDDADRPLVDQIGRNTEEAIAILNGVGLSEAHLYVKKPKQISEGQRYRFAVARLCDSGKPLWIADEFASALDPLTAALVARGLRRIASKLGATVVLAAPHVDHFVASLCPSKLVRLSWGDPASIYAARLRFRPLGKGVTRVVLENRGILPLTGVRIMLMGDEGEMNVLGITTLLPSGARTAPILVKPEQVANAVAIAALSAEGVGDYRPVLRSRNVKPGAARVEGRAYRP